MTDRQEEGGGMERTNAWAGTASRATRDIAARAATRRIAFLREEVSSGRVPETCDLGQAYLSEAERLEGLFPPLPARRPRTLPE